MKLTFPALTCLTLGASLLLGCTTSPSNDTLRSKSQTNSVYVEGVPGGAFSEVERISARVSAINHATRSVTLKDDEGNQRTVTAAPDVRNFEQVNVGDRVNITAAVETVVFLRPRGPTANEGSATRVLDNQGSNVALARTGTEQISARVTAVDLAQHRVTLQYPDRSSKTLAVRQDVPLSADSVGTEVVINTTSSMLITVEKP